MNPVFIVVGIIAILAVIIWLICGPKLPNGINKEIQADLNDEQPSQNGPNQTNSSESPPERRPTISEKSSRRHKLNRAKNCRECWTLGIEILGLLGLFAYASLTYSEWREMKRQTVEANRAWISVDAPIFQQAALVGEPVQIQIPYTNVGRGPGLNGKFSVLMDVIDNPVVNGVLDATKLPSVGEGFCKTNPPKIYVGTVFAEPNPNTLRKSSGDFSIVWTREMQRGEKLLRVRACLVYDSFHKPRYTWTCKVFWSGAFVPNNPGILIGFNCPDGSGAN